MPKSWKTELVGETTRVLAEQHLECDFDSCHVNVSSTPHACLDYPVNHWSGAGHAHSACRSLFHDLMRKMYIDTNALKNAGPIELFLGAVSVCRRQPPIRLGW